ncbi:MAG: DUF1329 domain-containing protein [Syntrophorhabdaceae bacterium]|nr:DUF1329 domain-containing protein [Syntrophorhabdaceae bacterium]MDD5242855.1 DUF1329 domain-containing protein [Syntrophorhabdaceae bacterium]
MKKIKTFGTFFLFIAVVLCSIALPLWSAERDYVVERIIHPEFDKHKRYFDDPRPVFTNWSWKKNMPPEQYAVYASDPEVTKRLWAETIGFKAPDVVGKIAPEIKPGKYSYNDKEKYPGLKALMVPALYERFKPGVAPSLAGNFPEMEIVPTRQYPWNLKIAQATKDNAGQAKLDEKGYLISKTLRPGFPFPKPSGKFAAQQYLYNNRQNYITGEDSYGVIRQTGFSKNLKPDYGSKGIICYLRLQGRAVTPTRPDGFFDERAKARDETLNFRVEFYAPRDRFGDALLSTYYNDVDKLDTIFMYIGALRRVRKLSNTDTQDTTGGSDYTYLDSFGFSQKMSPTLYPYKYEIVEDREYLFPYTIDGSDYLTSKGAEWHGLKFERRPVVVLKLTQLDKNFIYSKRMIYVDKETFQILHAEMYDQKGRLWRTYTHLSYYDTGTGIHSMTKQLIQDHLDVHTSINQAYFMPTVGWSQRNKFDITSLQDAVK